MIGCTSGHGFEGVVTHWSCTRLPGKAHRSLRKDACTGTWHPAAFSGKCPCRSIRFPSPRPCWTKPERSATDWSLDAGVLGRRTDCRRAQLWSETVKRGHLLTEFGSLRDQRAQIAGTFNMKNMEGMEWPRGVPEGGRCSERRKPRESEKPEGHDRSPSRKRRRPSPPKPSKTHCVVSCRSSSRR